MISWILLAAALGYCVYGLSLFLRKQPLEVSPTHEISPARLRVAAAIFVASGLSAGTAAIAGLLVESLGADDRIWYLFGAAVLLPVFSLVGLQSKKA